MSKDNPIATEITLIEYLTDELNKQLYRLKRKVEAVGLPSRFDDLLRATNEFNK